MVKELFKNESLSEKLLKKWFWLYLFTFLIAPTGYIIRIILSNNLPVSDVWLIYSIISFILIISIYNDLWLTASLQYFLPQYWIKKQYNKYKTSIFISLFVQISTWIIISLLLFYFADYLWDNYFQHERWSEILKLFCIYFLWINLYQIFSSIYRSFQDVFQDKMIEFIRMWSISSFTFLFFMIWKIDLYYFALAWVIWLILSLLFSIIAFSKKYWYTLKKWKIDLNKKYLKTYTSYALWMFLIWNASGMLWQVDIQMIVFFLWTTEVWYYSNYLSLINLVVMIITPLIWILFPIIRESVSKKDWKLRIIQNFYYKYFSALAIIIWWLFFMLWTEIATFLFWENFTYSWELLKYSALFIFVKVLIWINFSINSAIWKVKENSIAIWVTIIVNIGLNYILIPYIWTLWALISTVVCWFIMWYLTFRILNKFQKIKFDIIFFMRNIISILVFIIIYIIFIKEALILNNLVHILLVSFIYVLYVSLINYKEFYLLKNEVVKLKK